MVMIYCIVVVVSILLKFLNFSITTPNVGVPIKKYTPLLRLLVWYINNIVLVITLVFVLLLCLLSILVCVLNCGNSILRGGVVGVVVFGDVVCGDGFMPFEEYYLCILLKKNKVKGKACIKQLYNENLLIITPDNSIAMLNS